jgi:hypothetical protein
MEILFSIIIGAMLGFSVGQDYQEPIYKTNMSTYEIQYERCMEHDKATVSECHEVAQFKSLTCFGCE